MVKSIKIISVQLLGCNIVDSDVVLILHPILSNISNIAFNIIL